MSLNFLITGQENALTIKHLKSYLMSIYVNVALDLTNYRLKKKFKVYSNFFMCMNFFYYNGKYAAAIATIRAGSMLATLTLLSKSKLMPMHAISTEPTSER